MILFSLALAADPANGALLAGLAGCRACHTADDGVPYAGGHPVVTDKGTFYGSNLTPSQAGLGDWTYDDFVRAMRRGKSPSGRAYWPAFPYEDFQKISDDDLADLWAYLQSLPPDDTPSKAHEDVPPGFLRWMWRRLYFKGQDTPTDRGAYLGEAVGHCGACHTPRGKNGQRRWDEHLEGGTPPFSKAPAITPEALDEWTEADLIGFFEMGMLPDGDFTGSGMFRIVEEGTAKLSAEDRKALAQWLLRED